MMELLLLLYMVKFSLPLSSALGLVLADFTLQIKDLHSFAVFLLFRLKN